MKYKIALIGNPNSGKTTLYNSLTGSRQKVGNWPGVTVDKKEGNLKDHDDVIVTDLPGIYSLAPYSPEEIVSRDYIVRDKPDLLINLVDGSSLERNLYLTTQLLELNTPIIIALNMMDIVEKRGDRINISLLEKKFNVKIVETQALHGKGVDELIQMAVKGLEDKTLPLPKPITFSKNLSRLLETIKEKLSRIVPDGLKDYYAVKFFEQDRVATESIPLSPELVNEIQTLVRDYEKSVDDDAESIITGERYDFIDSIIDDILKRTHTGLTLSDKIDHVVTSRILGLPIFALAMFGIYYLSIQTVGTFATDWVNEVLFGEILPTNATAFLEGIGASATMISLLVDGALAGVGAVLGFLPQMAMLFLCLALLEDCGYMARVAFVMDRAFRKFGLSGKSFIPLLIGTGCSVPGIQASKTIENDRDRKITIMTTSFMPCGAKLPVIALIAGSIFNNNSFIGYAMYVLGIASVMITGIILKKTKAFASEPAPFVMELPLYHAPKISNVLKDVWEKCFEFVKRAGTVIFVSSIAIWFLSSYNLRLEAVDSNESILATLGGLIAPVFVPLGFGNWQATVATIQGFVAKEEVVSTFKILSGLSSDVADNAPNLYASFTALFTATSGMSFLVFNMLCMPCFAAVGAMRREFNSDKWTVFAVAYQMIYAYIISFIVYHLGNLYMGGPFTIATGIAILLIVSLLYMLLRPNPYDENGFLIKESKLAVNQS